MRKESGADTADKQKDKEKSKGKDKETKNAEAAPSSKPEETREQRAKRLTAWVIIHFLHNLFSLVDMHLKKTPINVDGAIKSMRKAKEVRVSLFCCLRSF